MYSYISSCFLTWDVFSSSAGQVEGFTLVVCRFFKEESVQSWEVKGHRLCCCLQCEETAASRQKLSTETHSGRVNAEQRRSSPLSPAPDGTLFKQSRVWPLTSETRHPGFNLNLFVTWRRRWISSSWHKHGRLGNLTCDGSWWSSSGRDLRGLGPC